MNYVTVIQYILTDEIYAHIHLFMLQLKLIHLLFFYNGCKGNPQKALLKAASSRLPVIISKWAMYIIAVTASRVSLMKICY